MYINNPDHMTKMAAMPIYMYGKYPSKIISRTGGPISMKLSWHEALMTKVLLYICTTIYIYIANIPKLKTYIYTVVLWLKTQISRFNG